MVYTKTGDTGTTSLIDGIRISKDDSRLEAYGTIDELNCHIGLLTSIINNHENSRKYIIQLQWIQNILFSVGSFLATDQNQSQLKTICIINEQTVEEIEKYIDEIENTLHRNNAFILPGGAISASQSNICRAVCRRAERRIISLKKQDNSEAKNYANLLCFINRLSDYFFVLGRKLNNIEQKEEIFWKKSCI